MLSQVNKGNPAADEQIRSILHEYAKSIPDSVDEMTIGPFTIKRDTKVSRKDADVIDLLMVLSVH